MHELHAKRQLHACSSWRTTSTCAARTSPKSCGTRRWIIPRRSFAKTTSACSACAAFRCARTMQSVKIWDLLGTGSRTVVDASYNRRIQDTECTYCGQCITHCPTAALRERDDTGLVFDAIDDPNVVTVAQVAPAVRAAWAEQFGLAQRVRNAEAHGRGAARAGLQLCVRHRLCRRPHDHGGRQRVYRALHPQGPVSVADVHVLLPGLGALCEVPVPRTDGQSLHGQVAPADVRRGGEELLCRKGRHRPQAPFRRLRSCRACRKRANARCRR